MATFKLNGTDVDFQPGELVIHAAARHGVNIPFYCYHPELSSPANCRMCLVELAGNPKLIPSCQWACNDKMDVQTETPRVQGARKDVMEFLLINHPLDCPICDQAGECKLQQYAYLFGPPASRMEEPKVELEKRKVLGPHVVLDQERCISCTRCVRFCEEVTGTAELAMVHRTSAITVDRHPDKELNNAYSGCVVDMCPVGALTDRQFRFDSRVWYVNPTPTTCTLCARGCSINADSRAAKGARALVRRVRARRNPQVNKSWICDEGRYGHLRAQEEGRPVRARSTPPPARPDEPGATLDAAVAVAAALLARGGGGAGWLGVLASGAESNEELAALAQLARSADPGAALVVPAWKDGDEDGILRRLDKSANQRGARLLGYGPDAATLRSCKLVLVVDADARAGGLLAEAPVREAVGAAALIAFAAHDRAWLRGAEVVFPLANAYEKEGTLVNFDGVVQRLARVVVPPGDARPATWLASSLAAAAGLAPVPGDPVAWLEILCARGPFVGLEPARLTQWGARLSPSGGGAEHFPEPLQLFPSAPRAYAEGEYSPFVSSNPPPAAVHVAAGLPSLAQVASPPAGTMPAMVPEGRQPRRSQLPEGSE